uniref:(California timema) hypothetical protein n=1 Tax=Timema californicum TaxID=61474 RepID=A0A7R9IZ41_TIMCA|nr:unnamed protein product [Timema californicum]
MFSHHGRNCMERGENCFVKTTLSKSNRVSNPDVSVISSFVQPKSDALSHAATETCLSTFNYNNDVDCSRDVAAESCRPVSFRRPRSDSYVDEARTQARSVPGFTCCESENHLGKTTPNRDANLDLPVIISVVYCENSALDHATTEKGSVPGFTCCESENHLGKTTLSTPNRDANLDFPVIISVVYCENSALDHATTEKGNSGGRVIPVLVLVCLIPQWQQTTAMPQGIADVFEEPSIGPSPEPQPPSEIPNEPTTSRPEVDFICPHQNTTSKCPHQTNGSQVIYYPNPENCATYFECDNTVLRLIHCANGTWYSSKLNVCTFPHESDCTQPESLKKPDSESNRLKKLPVLRFPVPSSNKRLSDLVLITFQMAYNCKQDPEISGHRNPVACLSATCSFTWISLKVVQEITDEIPKNQHKTDLIINWSKLFAVSTPGSVEFNQHILLFVKDYLVKVCRHKDLYWLLVPIFWEVLRKQVTVKVTTLLGEEEQEMTLDFSTKYFLSSLMVELYHKGQSFREVEDSRPVAGTTPIYTRPAIAKCAQFMVLNQLVQESPVRVVDSELTLTACLPTQFQQPHIGYILMLSPPPRSAYMPGWDLGLTSGLLPLGLPAKSLNATSGEEYSRIQDSQLEHVKGKITAYEVLTSLQERFEKRGTTSRMVFNKKLHTMRYRPSVEMFSEYCLKFDKLFRELKTAGELFDEEGIVIKFLLTMPGELEGVVSGLQTLGADKMSLEFVRQRIDEEEMALNESKGGRTRKGGQSMTISGTRKEVVSRTKPGNNVLSGNVRQKGRYPFKCQYCGIQGHKRHECWKSVSVNECSVTQCDRGKSDTWVLDLGAIDHLAMKDTLVVNCRKLDKPMTIGVARSKVFLEAKAQIQLYTKYASFCGEDEDGPPQGEALGYEAPNGVPIGYNGSGSGEGCVREAHPTLEEFLGIGLLDSTEDVQGPGGVGADLRMRGVEASDGGNQQQAHPSESTEIDLLVRERVGRYLVKKNGLDLDKESRNEWHDSLAIRHERMESDWVATNNYATQPLTAHENFNAKLHGFGLKENPDCEACGAREDAEHVLLACERLEKERGILRLEVGGPSSRTTMVIGTTQQNLDSLAPAALEIAVGVRGRGGLSGLGSHRYHPLKYGLLSPVVPEIAVGARMSVGNDYLITSEIQELSKRDDTYKPIVAPENVVSVFTFKYPLQYPSGGIIKEPTVDEDGDLIVQRWPETAEGIIAIEHSSSSTLELVGRQIWRGALLLADFVLHHGSSLLSNRTVLELGSGVGFTSVVAGMFASEVVCTDVNNGGILDLIRGNAKRNHKFIKAKFSVVGLDFFAKEWSKVLIIYDNDLTEAFVETLVKILNTPPAKTVYIALEKRYVFTVADLDTGAPCYEHFLHCLDQARSRSPASSWSVEQLAIDFPQYFNYDRIPESSGVWCLL